MFKTTPILHSITIQSDNHKSTRGDWMLHAVIYFLSFSFFSFQLYEIVSRYRVTICIHEIGLQDLSTEQPESRITWARIAVDRSWKNSWMFLRLSKISHTKYCMWKQQLNPATAAGQPSRGIVWFFIFIFFALVCFFPQHIYSAGACFRHSIWSFRMEFRVQAPSSPICFSKYGFSQIYHHIQCTNRSL